MSDIQRLVFDPLHYDILSFVEIALAQILQKYKDTSARLFYFDPFTFTGYSLRHTQKGYIQFRSQYFKVKVEVNGDWLSDIMTREGTYLKRAYDFEFKRPLSSVWESLPGEVLNEFNNTSMPHSLFHDWLEKRDAALRFVHRSLISLPDLEYGEIETFFTRLLPPKITYDPGSNDLMLMIFEYTDFHGNISVKVVHNNHYGYAHAVITFAAHAWLGNTDRVIQVTRTTQDKLIVKLVEGPPFKA